MAVILIKFFGIGIAAVVIIYMAASALRSARRLDRRIREFKKEQEALEKERGKVNPYAALADLYADREQEKKR